MKRDKAERAACAIKWALGMVWYSTVPLRDFPDLVRLAYRRGVK